VAAAFLVAFLLALYFATAHRAASIYDEGPHFDYIYQLLHGRLPKTASQMSPETIWQLTCRGGLPWYLKPHCAHLAPLNVPGHDVNSALPYFPLYYGLAALVAGPLHALGVDIFTAARIGSCVLYSVGAAVLALALIRLRVPRVAALGVVLALVAIPAFLYQGSTVTPDSMALLCGAAGLLVVTLRGSWRRRVLWGTAVATATALTKPNFLPLAGVTVLLVLLVRQDDDGRVTVRLPRWRMAEIRLTVVALVTPVLLAGAWELFRLHDMAPGETDVDGGVTKSLLHTDAGLGSLILQAAQYLSQPFSSTPFPRVPGGIALAVLLAHAVLVGGSIVVALSTRRESVTMANVLAIAGVGGLALSAVYMPTTFYVSYHTTGTVSRYAFPMVPLCVAGVAMTISGRFTRYLILACGVVFALYVFALLHSFYG
jgi:hypothetical protein